MRWGLALLFAVSACAAGTPDTPDGAPADARSTTVELTVTPVGPGTASVSPAGTACGAGCSAHPQRTEVTITAAPNAGGQVTSWSGPCSTVGSGTTCTFTILADVTIEIGFAQP